MLQRDREMFKLIYKNYIKKFVALCFLSVLLAGCSKSVKEETAQVVVKEENKPPEKEVQPEEKQKEKLSEMYDWDNARIPIDWYYPNFWEGQILQNQDYIFYPEDGNKIARISKSDGSKEWYYVKFLYKLNRENIAHTISQGGSVKKFVSLEENNSFLVRIRI